MLARRAFSLIETLFSLMILAFVSAGVFTLFSSNTFGALISPDQTQTTTDAQAALRSLAGDLHAGTAFATPANPVSGPGIRVTVSGGGAIEYYLDGTALKRLATATGTTTTVLTGLLSGSGLAFQYSDSSMNAIAAPMDVAKYDQAAAVDVTLTVAMPHAAFGQLVRTMRMVLRNKAS